MTEFADFLRGLGLQPRQIIADGRWRRCPTSDKPKKRNGAYKLDVSGRIGWAQNHGPMQYVATWRIGGSSHDTPPDELDLAALRMAQAQAAEWARVQREKAEDAASRFWFSCKQLRGGHPYLEAKGLDAAGTVGIRVDAEGWLVIPAMRGHELVSVQRIAPDGTKRFWSGAPIGGSFYTIERRDAALTVLCEGFATGLACFHAHPMARVLVCWDSGNLAKAPVRPRGLVVIAADNDHGTMAKLGRNPGLDAAREAADLIGCGIAYPSGIEGTDWADARIERVAHARRAAAASYRTFTTIGRIKQAVDAQIASELQRHARFCSPRLKNVRSGDEDNPPGLTA